MSDQERHFLFGLTVGELGFLFFFIMLLIAFFEISDRDEELRTLSSDRDAEKRALALLKKAMPTDSDVDLDSVFVELARLERENAELTQEAERNSGLQEIVTTLTSELEQYERLKDFVASEGESGGTSTEDLERISDLVAAGITVEKKLGQFGIETHDLENAVEGLVESNTDLRGQLEFTRRQGRGIDFPPCWPNDQGKPEYTFDVRILADGSFSLSRAIDIPQRRLDNYENLPNVRAITSEPLPASLFHTLAQPILDLSNANDCRYYVTIDFESVDACRYQLAVEQYFYKYISKREQDVCIQ